MIKNQAIVGLVIAVVRFVVSGGRTIIPHGIVMFNASLKLPCVGAVPAGVYAGMLGGAVLVSAAESVNVMVNVITVPTSAFAPCTPLVLI